jgi:RNA polymerase sigma-70 factor (ECF subfamily)
MSVHTTPPSLLLRLRDHHDQEAWESFCSVYGSLLYGYCRKRGLDSNDSADISQEVMIRVARGIRSFNYDRSKGRFRDWLATILRNEIARWFKRKKNDKHDSLLLNQLSVDDSSWNEMFQQHVLKAALTHCRERFEPPTWEAFELVWIRNRPAPEVAKEMGKPLEFVYTAKSRVLKRLAIEVDRLAEDADI